MPTPHTLPESTVHCLVPYAASSDPACQAHMATLALPNLRRLLGLMTPVSTIEGDEFSPIPSHERALAQALGWPDHPAPQPWAAWVHPDNPAAQAWIHLCHFQVGMDQVQLIPGDQLAITEAESLALLRSIDPLFREDGLNVTMDSPVRWHAQGDVLRAMPSVSLDQVAGRSIDRWMHSDASDSDAQRWWRRLQNEAQMLFYTHPVNDARDAQRLPSINGLWIDGAGALPMGLTPAPLPDQLIGLKSAALRGDWAAWAAAWTALDNGPVARLLAQARAGTKVRLTLCGERHARTWQGPVTGLSAIWQRLRPLTTVPHILQSL